jgi:hypothetical protein
MRVRGQSSGTQNETKQNKNLEAILTFSMHNMIK